MSAFTFRPLLELLDGRCLPSGSPAISIGDAYVTEGHSGQTELVFLVTLSKASSRQVSANFATADGSAAAGSDFVGQMGRLTFAPGETANTITVLINGDTDVEGHERLAINLSGARNAKIADATAVGTILNDDLYPNTYIDPISGWPIPPLPPPPEDDCNWGPYGCQ